MRTLRVNVLGWALLAAHIGYADANTILLVNKNDPRCSDISGAPFCSIQAAINVAQPHDGVGVDGGGVYFESIRIRTDDLIVNSSGHPTINRARIEAIRVFLDGFNVNGGGIVATTLPGSSNCTEAGIADNVVSNSDIVLDHCEDAAISRNVVNGGGISVSFSGNAEVEDNIVDSGSGFRLFMSRGATLVRTSLQIMTATASSSMLLRLCLSTIKQLGTGKADL